MRRIHRVNASKMNRIVVARPVDGITLNGELEFLLDDSGNIRVFDSEEQAREFLTTAGVEPEELRHIICLPLENAPIPPEGGQSYAEHDRKTRS